MYQPDITCPRFKKEVLSAMRKIAIGISGCLSPAEKYLSDFLLQGTDAVLNYVCKDNDMNNLNSEYFHFVSFGKVNAT